MKVLYIVLFLILALFMSVSVYRGVIYQRIWEKGCKRLEKAKSGIAKDVLTEKKDKALFEMIFSYSAMGLAFTIALVLYSYLVVY